MTILFEVGMACGTADFAERAVEIAEDGAQRNPDVATLTGLALNMRGLFNHDLAMVDESVRVLRHSPRRVLLAAGAEGYGTMLLDAGQRDAALRQLDAAWDDYDRVGAFARRATVQRVMRQAGVRRQKWVSDADGSQPHSLTDGERRVVYLIADGLHGQIGCQSAWHIGEYRGHSPSFGIFEARSPITGAIDKCAARAR